jgi:branched-chain amino acid transport system substrate-binding protein
MPGSKNTKKTALVAVLCCASVVLAACGSASESSSTGPIRIGWSGPLTTAEAYFGSTGLKGAQLAQGEVKLTGKLAGRRIELVALDDAADPAQAVTVAKRFTSQKLDAVIGPIDSGPMLAAGPIYQRANMPTTTTGSNPDIIERKFPNVVQLIANDVRQGGAMVQYAKGAGVTSVAVFNDSQAFGQGVASAFAKAAPDAGLSVTGETALSTNTQDYSSAVNDALSKHPDAIYFGGGVTPGGLLCRQARAAGFEGLFMGPDGIYDPAFIKGCGRGVGKVAVSFQSPPYDSGGAVTEFAQRYQAKYHAEPGPYSAYGYTQLGFLVAALNKAQTTDHAAVIKAMRSITYAGPLGPVRVDGDGALVDGPLFVYAAKDGKFSFVHEVE